jgi:ATP synthase protein I
MPSEMPEVSAPEQQKEDVVTGNSMDEYYQLKKSIFFVTLAATGIISLLVYLSYSLTTALSYLIGACVGIIYLRMLAKDVEKVSGNNPRTGSGRLALVAGMIIVATQWDKLEVLPIFLGFLTYKFTIIFYVIPTTLLETQRSD